MMECGSNTPLVRSEARSACAGILLDGAGKQRLPGKHAMLRRRGAGRTRRRRVAAARGGWCGLRFVVAVAGDRAGTGVVVVRMRTMRGHQFREWILVAV